MTRYFPPKTAAAASVSALLRSLGLGSPSTTTITQEKSGGFFVSTVIEESSEDIALLTAKFFSETQVNT